LLWYNIETVVAPLKFEPSVGFDIEIFHPVKRYLSQDKNVCRVNLLAIAFMNFSIANYCVSMALFIRIKGPFTYSVKIKSKATFKGRE
jgi:hypothetical protein